MVLGPHHELSRPGCHSHGPAAPSGGACDPVWLLRARAKSARVRIWILAISTVRVDKLKLAGELSSITGTTVDLVDAWTMNYAVLVELVREGVVILEARQGLAASWRTRALLELETDRPVFDRMNRAFLDRVASRGIL